MPKAAVGEDTSMGTVGFLYNLIPQIGYCPRNQLILR